MVEAAVHVVMAGSAWSIGYGWLLMIARRCVVAAVVVSMTILMASGSAWRDVVSWWILC